MGTRHPGRARTGRHPARGLSAVRTALVLFIAALGAARAADPPRESLDHFPTAELSVESGGRSHAFKVWIAATEPRRNQGLMYVEALPAARGMLFLFDAPQPAVFWMKNTLISLDLLFIAPDGRVIRIAEDATPMSEATIDSMGLVSGVLELAGGTSRRLGFKVGDRVRYAAFGNH